MKTIAVAQAALLALFIAGAADAAAAGNRLDNGSIDASYCYHHISGHGCGSVPGWNGAFPLVQGSGLLPANADTPSWSDADRHGAGAGAFIDNSAASVPEPDHYSMLLIGLLLLALTAPGHATEKFIT